MRDFVFTGIMTILCFAIVGATIVTWAYIAYNPKVCPLGEQHGEPAQ